MDESQRRRTAFGLLVGIAIVFSVMAGVAALMHQAPAALEFVSTAVIMLLVGILILKVRANADGPWWNKPISFRTRRRLIALFGFIVVMLILVSFFTDKLFGPAVATIETAVLGLFALAASFIGWRRLGRSD